MCRVTCFYAFHAFPYVWDRSGRLYHPSYTPKSGRVFDIEIQKCHRWRSFNILEFISVIEDAHIGVQKHNLRCVMTYRNSDVSSQTCFGISDVFPTNSALSGVLLALRPPFPATTPTPSKHYERQCGGVEIQLGYPTKWDKPTCMQALFDGGCPPYKKCLRAYWCIPYSGRS